jgi:hypothetical protein
MSIKGILKDGQGGTAGAKVSCEGAVNVVVHPHPPVSDALSAIPIRQYFVDATNCCSNDMQVVGTLANPVVFSISADPIKDVYIKTASIIIADASAILNKFGNINALTNGVVFQWVTADLGITTIHEALKSNFDFVRLAGGNPSFGATTTVFRASNVEGSSEGYIPVLDFAAIFGLPWGLRLRAGTTDKLCWSVRDDTTGVDAFNVVGYGIKI